ncbi:MAG: [NiFe]-hydrogenase assembly chaperone HybE [Candidatus Thiodiazotropha sp.]
MTQIENLSRNVEAVFKLIEQEQMQGIPILNPALRVETLGFQTFEGRAVGIVITPWMMNLMLLPAEGEDWSGLKTGDKTRHRFPANEFPFMVNEFDGIGICQTHSPYSPMHEFMDQDHAVAAAESFMQTLMTPVENPDTDPFDEALLGRILRGEETPEVVMDGFALAEEAHEAEKPCGATQESLNLTRRELLLKGFS